MILKSLYTPTMAGSYKLNSRNVSADLFNMNGLQDIHLPQNRIPFILHLSNPSMTLTRKKSGKGAVLIDQHPSEKMYDKLVDAGARCILCYVTVNSSAYSNWAMISTLKESNKNPIPVFNIPNIAGQRMREELEKGIYVSIKYSCKTTIAQGNPKTVVATLQGQTDEYYIVCAHGDSDSGGPGADDNASGESGVLEVARILKIVGE